MFISILGTMTDERDICEGQVAEEEVHGGVEVRIQADEQDDEQVPLHCGQVHAQERAKNTPCCSGWMGRPKRRNSVMLLWLSKLMMLFYAQMKILENIKV